MRSKEYSRLSNASNDFIERDFVKPRRNWVPWVLTLCNTALALVTIYLSLVQDCRCTDKLVDRRYRNATLNAVLKETSTYSPLFNEIDLALKLHRLDGTFKSNTSIFRQPPSPEVDSAWDFFSSSIFTTTASHLTQNDILPSSAVKAPLSWNRGEDAYIIQLDVFHQIHCLNWLRKDLNWEYYYPGKKPSEWWLQHRAHCIHVLLQTLMCHADLDIVSYNWVRKPESEPGGGKVVPDPDFSVLKMCRDFEGLVEWAERNQVEDAQGKRERLTAPGDAVVQDWPY